MRLYQKYIKDLKVVLNIENLLKLLPKNGIVAEIGVDNGDFSNKILFFAKLKKLYLIDKWDSVGYDKSKMNYVSKRFQNQIDDGIVIVIKGKSEKVLRKFENQFFDWVYIDTSHSYKQTLRELELCRMKVKNSGIIAGHDYCQGNVKDTFAYDLVQAVN